MSSMTFKFVFPHKQIVDGLIVNFNITHTHKKLPCTRLGKMKQINQTDKTTHQQCDLKLSSWMWRKTLCTAREPSCSLFLFLTLCQLSLTRFVHLQRWYCQCQTKKNKETINSKSQQKRTQNWTNHENPHHNWQQVLCTCHNLAGCTFGITNMIKLVHTGERVSHCLFWSTSQLCCLTLPTNSSQFLFVSIHACECTLEYLFLLLVFPLFCCECCCLLFLWLFGEDVDCFCVLLVKKKLFESSNLDRKKQQFKPSFFCFVFVLLSFLFCSSFNPKQQLLFLSLFNFAQSQCFPKQQEPKLTWVSFENSQSWDDNKHRKRQAKSKRPNKQTQTQAARSGSPSEGIWRNVSIQTNSWKWRKQINLQNHAHRTTTHLINQTLRKFPSEQNTQAQQVRLRGAFEAIFPDSCATKVPQKLARVVESNAGRLLWFQVPCHPNPARLNHNKEKGRKKQNQRKTKNKNKSKIVVFLSHIVVELVGLKKSQMKGHNHLHKFHKTCCVRKKLGSCHNTEHRSTPNLKSSKHTHNKNKNWSCEECDKHWTKRYKTWKGSGIKKPSTSSTKKLLECEEMSRAKCFCCANKTVACDKMTRETLCQIGGKSGHWMQRNAKTFVSIHWNACHEPVLRCLLFCFFCFCYKEVKSMKCCVFMCWFWPDSFEPRT